MKQNIEKLLLLVLGVFFLASCEKDNYEAPKSMYTGAILYKGDTVCVASKSAVYFELREPGWQFNTPIKVLVKTDGTFSAVLFNANYKMVLPATQGPYLSPSDTTVVAIAGNTNQNIEVMPYYMIRNAAFTAAARTVTGSCNLEQIVLGDQANAVERVTMYVSYTYYADQFSNDVSADAALTDLNNLSVNVTVPLYPTRPTQSYVYVRLGVKIQNVDDMIYTTPRKVNI